MVLDLANVIGMNDNVVVGVGYLEVICPDQDVRAHRPEWACEFGTSRCRCLGVDWHGVPVVSPGSVEDLAVLLARFH
jgi:hypothetical protein